MNILIIGNGGREHAIAWKVAQSSLTETVWVAPGNAGTQQEEKINNIDIQATDIDGLIQFAKKKSIDLTIVGPEAPLALGIVDQFQKNNLACFGPSKAAAQLESSKSFSKAFMQRANIPTAKYKTFTQAEAAIHYAHQQSLPLVIKADGLAAGKGVVIAETYLEAENAIRDMLEHNVHGDADSRILIEEFLQGEEMSFIVMTDGTHILPLASSQDHKRRDENDQGPNTGGMGAYSPVPQFSRELENKIITTIIKPTVDLMAKENAPYLGFLYAGLMISNDQPYVLEFNCRLGDPETQAIMMRLQSDLVTLCTAALDKKLDQVQANWDPRFAITVVMAAGGYPGHYHKGDVISGLNSTDHDECKVFHAGTTIKNQQIVTNGGRVLGITALGSNLKSAKQRAYAAASNISWPHCFFRKDIGDKAHHVED